MISSIQNSIATVALLAFMCGSAAIAQTDTVKVTEDSIQIPTYSLGSEDLNPPFRLLNEHDIYPYTMLDDLTNSREPKTYKAIVLENKYLRATVLPELGGRLYSLYDKIADREVFYRNRSVKYGLVALRGAWISGGIEFNFPNGHSTDTVSPVSCRFEVDPDGSATVVVGDVDQVSEMYWQVALTLRPGTARLEQHVRLFNPTSTEHLYWYWNNAAVRATDDARFIYPMRLASPGVDSHPQTYPEWHGVDYSRYASFHEPSELFGIGVHRNFFGVYYADANYGVIHYADHRQVTGKKFWTWGVAGDGTIWTDLLTDADGPYNEIQAGRFETQFNREIMPPQADESWTEYWYPVKQLDGGFVEATDKFAVNVSFVPTSGVAGEVSVSVNPTERIAHARLQFGVGDRVERSFDSLTFDPAASRTFVTRYDDLEVARRKAFIDILDSSGKVLLHWSAADPVDGNSDPVLHSDAKLVEKNGKKDLSVQEEYLKGVQQDKRGDHAAAEQLFEDTLKRDPSYTPALRTLAMQDYTAGDFTSASDKIERAVLQDNSDAETQYEAGTIWRATGDISRARDAFWNCIRREVSPSRSFLQLGEIALSAKEYASAVQLLRNALKYQSDNVLAQSDLAVALRLNGELAEAANIASAAVKTMPLYPLPLAERWRLSALGNLKTKSFNSAEDDWNQVAGHRAQSYLEAGAWYWSLSDYDSVNFILKSAIRNLPSPEISPMIYYYLASSAHHRGREDEFAAYATKAHTSSLDKIFVNRLSDAVMLKESLLLNPNDARAEYLLGNFMFQHERYAEAEDLWKRAQGLGLDYSVLYRNLGVDAWKVKKSLGDAESFYEKAVRLVPDDYRLYVDLDEIYAQLGATEKRARLFANAPPNLLDHDAARIRYILCLMKQGEYDRALSLLDKHQFRPWEQGADVREIFVAAYLRKAQRDISTGDFPRAEEHISRAFDYPANLGVGKPNKPNDAAAHYWLGELRSKQGNMEAAKLEWNQVIEFRESDMSKYYAALALQHLGRDAEATESLTLLAEGPEKGRVSAHNYYVAGLAAHRLGHESEATRDMQKAVEINPSLWQAEDDFDR